MCGYQSNFLSLCKMNRYDWFDVHCDVLVLIHHVNMCSPHWPLGARSGNATPTLRSLLGARLAIIFCTFPCWDLGDFFPFYRVLIPKIFLLLDWFLNLELTKGGEGERDLARDASSIANVEFEEHSVPLPNSYESHEERAVNKYIYIYSFLKANV